MMNGCWVMVCGPSGAGKDSVMAAAASALAGDPRIRFAPRLVARACAPDDADVEISRTALQALHTGGALAWYWEANGCAYGIRAEEGQAVAAGQLVVVNGSRAHVASLGRRPDLRQVLVTAPPRLLQARLQQRGRDGPAAIAQRLARNASLPGLAADCVIDNACELAAAAASLRRYLLRLAGDTA